MELVNCVNNFPNKIPPKNRQVKNLKNTFPMQISVTNLAFNPAKKFLECLPLLSINLQLKKSEKNCQKKSQDKKTSISHT
jgi:hypothetical protein